MEERIMNGESAPLEIGMSVVRGCLVVPIQLDLHDDTVLRIRADILKSVEAAAAKGVIIDLTAVRVLDTFAFAALADTARTASLLGATTVLAGIQPGVASALVDLDIEFEGIGTARTLEDAFRQLEPIVSPPAETEETEDAADEDRAVDESSANGG
jgi:rsbT antagonist protein RsbS